jgi:hypothetical protein
MNKRIIDYMRKISFHAKWLIMSDRDRYVYLWNRTRNSLGFQTFRYLESVSYAQGLARANQPRITKVVRYIEQ